MGRLTYLAALALLLGAAIAPVGTSETIGFFTWQPPSWFEGDLAATIRLSVDSLSECSFLLQGRDNAEHAPVHHLFVLQVDETASEEFWFASHDLVQGSALGVSSRPTYHEAVPGVERRSLSVNATVESTAEILVAAFGVVENVLPFAQWFVRIEVRCDNVVTSAAINYHPTPLAFSALSPETTAGFGAIIVPPASASAGIGSWSGSTSASGGRLFLHAEETTARAGAIRFDHAGGAFERDLADSAAFAAHVDVAAGLWALSITELQIGGRPAVGVLVDAAVIDLP